MLRLSELYTSIQGEGPNVGLPTQFVRFAGCNLRCPGWPCDTPHAIDPAIWRREAERLDGVQLFERLAPWPRALTLTGGEPFLQPDDDLRTLCELAWMSIPRGYQIDVFTNGTVKIPDWALRDMTIILDWKLAGSGENFDTFERRLLRNTREANVRELKETDYVKFTVASMQDLDEARDWFITYLVPTAAVKAQFTVGGVWDMISDAEIIDYIRRHELPWRLNVQLHKHIWQPEARRV